MDAVSAAAGGRRDAPSGVIDGAPATDGVLVPLGEWGVQRLIELVDVEVCTDVEDVQVRAIVEAGELAVRRVSAPDVAPRGGGLVGCVVDRRVVVAVVDVAVEP